MEETSYILYIVGNFSENEWDLLRPQLGPGPRDYHLPHPPKPYPKREMF